MATEATPVPAVPTNAQLLFAAAAIYAHIHGTMNHTTGADAVDTAAATRAVQHARALWAAVIAPVTA